MRALNAMLQDLGVPNQLVIPLLKKVAVQTLDRSCGVLNQYSGSRCAKQTAAGHLEPSLATDSPPDADGGGAADQDSGQTRSGLQSAQPGDVNGRPPSDSHPIGSGGVVQALSLTLRSYL